MKVSTDKNKERIRAMFDSIAHSYDRLNHSLSLGIDRLWRRRVTRMADRVKARNVLDIATGTGDMAIALARLECTESVVGGDFSENMLTIARKKAAETDCGHKITFLREDALDLSMADESVVMTTVAGGARHFAGRKRGVGQFPQRERFTEIMAQAGWRNCRYESLTFGIATLYTAEK